MKKITPSILCLVTLGLVNTSQAVAVFTTATGTGNSFATTGFSVSSADLVNAGASTLASVTSAGFNAAALVEVNNGTVVDAVLGVGDANVTPASSITFNLDITTNTAGYDITSIFTLGAGNQRAAQGYDVTFTFVDGSTSTIISASTATDAVLGTFDDSVSGGTFVTTDSSFFNNFDGLGFTTVDISDPTGLLGTGVASVTFDNFSEANRAENNGFTIFREFDVLGTATVLTVPEPSSVAFLLGGISMLGLRRRRLA